MKQFSLKLKLFAAAGLLVALTVAIQVASTAVSLDRASGQIREHSTATMEQEVLSRLHANAGQYAEQIEAFINEAYSIPQGMAAIIAASIEQGANDRANALAATAAPAGETHSDTAAGTDTTGSAVTTETGPAAANQQRQLTREQMQALIRANFSAHPQVSSIYAQFEPNAYDSRDAEFTSGFEHSSSQGTLELYFVRNRDGNIQAVPVADPSVKYLDKRNEFGIREAEWYLCPKDTLKPCAMEPYLFQIEEGYSELMTSLTFPIVVNGQFAGVTGVDLNLPVFQKLVDELSKSLYGGQNRVTLLSQIGLIAGSSYHKTKLARPIQEAVPEQGDTLASLHRSEGVLVTDEDFIVAYPIDIQASGNQWSLLIRVPKAVALAELNVLNQEVASMIQGSVLQQVVLGILVVGLGLAATSLLVRSISSPISNLRDRMLNLASSEGDLVKQVDIDTHAELISLAGGFNQFQQKLRNMIVELKNITQDVREKAQESARIAADTNENIGRQHHEIDSVVTAMNEMSAAASEVASFASSAAGDAREATEIVLSSQTTLSSAVSGVKELAQDMSTASGAIAQVASRSDDINKIVDVIRSIAEQTNLLALNAAIEAARAGEAGRGFAVVADEVRTLASRTRSSTDEISQLIDSLQSEVRTTVNVINTGVERATGAVSKTDESFAALVRVVETIGAISDHVSQVATAAEEQSSVSEEINRNLTVIGDAVSQLADLARDAKYSSDTLQVDVKALDEQLGRLRT